MQIYCCILVLLLVVGLVQPKAVFHDGSSNLVHGSPIGSKRRPIKSQGLSISQSLSIPAKTGPSSIVAKESNAKTTAGPTEEIDLRTMIKVNLLMFFFYLTLGSAMPYIPMYYRALKIPDAQIGNLGAITPATNFLVSPLWGAFADSSSLHIEIMVITFILSVIARFTLFYANHWSNVFVIATVVCLIAVLGV